MHSYGYNVARHSSSAGPQLSFACYQTFADVYRNCGVVKLDG